MSKTPPFLLEANEATVREEVLAPFLRQLGYKTGTDADIHREVNLVYPKIYLGTKSNKDPFIRGRADYIIEVKDHARWVLEAKASDHVIDNESAEQAYTYAIHGEVRAVYFVISNGKRLVVYNTSQPPSGSPVLDLFYDDFALANSVLGPDAIRQKFPKTGPIGSPLAPGLGSIAKVISGKIRYQKLDFDHPLITETQVSIVDGNIERGSDLKLVATIVVQGPFSSIHDLVHKLGLDHLTYTSEDKEISSDRDNPTVFRYQGAHTLPKGERLFDPKSQTYVTLENGINCNVVSVVKAHFHQGVVRASIENQANFGPNPSQGVSFSGVVEMNLV